jgi:hypothetical protein
MIATSHATGPSFFPVRYRAGAEVTALSAPHTRGPKDGTGTSSGHASTLTSVCGSRRRCKSRTARARRSGACCRASSDGLVRHPWPFAELRKGTKSRPRGPGVTPAAILFRQVGNTPSHQMLWRPEEASPLIRGRETENSIAGRVAAERPCGTEQLQLHRSPCRQPTDGAPRVQAARRQTFALEASGQAFSMALAVKIPIHLAFGELRRWRRRESTGSGKPQLRL